MGPRRGARSLETPLEGRPIAEAVAGVADEEVVIFLARIGRIRPELAEIYHPRTGTAASGLRKLAVAFEMSFGRKPTLPAWAFESTVADRDLPTQTGAHLTAVQNAKTYRIVNGLLLIRAAKAYGAGASFSAFEADCRRGGACGRAGRF